MCHIILMMPIISLFLFWVLPFSKALPIYIGISAISGFIYFAILRVMKQPSQSGPESMVGEPVEIIKKLDPKGQVLFKGEIWKAESSDTLRKGDRAEIISVKGLTLKVGKPSQNGKMLSPKTHKSL